MNGFILLIISFIGLFVSQQNIDVLILKQASVKGRFISYDHRNQSISFYNQQSQDTDVIGIKEVKYLFYNTLAKEQYDTLYSSYANVMTGKILYKDQQELVFWDFESKKILSLNPRNYLNIIPSSKFTSFLALRNFYLSFAVFLFIFGMSLLLSKDYVSAVLFGLFGLAIAYMISIIQKIIKL